MKHLDLEAIHSAAVIADAVERAAQALDAEPRRIIDLGAGTGSGTLALVRRFPHARVDALDLSAALLERLESSAQIAGAGDRVQAHRVDLDDDWMQVVDTSADIIWAALSLHHVGDAAQVLRRAFTALRPGGVLVVTEMTDALRYEPGDLESGLDGLAGRLVTALAGMGYPPTADWSRELSDAGFDSVKRHDHTVTVTGETTEGAQYLLPQLRGCRERLSSELTAHDKAGLDGAIDRLETGRSRITQTSGRAIWVAIRPAA